VIHIHDGVNPNVGAVGGSLDFFSLALVRLGRRLHNFKAYGTRQFETVSIAEIFRQHLQENAFFDEAWRRQ
jgi:hypothetical protein